MPSVISWGNSAGDRRRCDANCHDAKGSKCVCICGGRNHGVGYEKAVANAQALFGKWAGEKAKAFKLSPAQPELPIEEG